MFNRFRKKLALALSPELVTDQKKNDEYINARVAAIIAHLDPLDLLLKEYNGIFSEEFEHPEERLDSKGQLGMSMMGYQLENDIHFNFLLDFLANSAGNETIKRAPVTTERVLYGRAQISNVMLLKQEIKRLSSLYKEKLEKDKLPEFDSTNLLE